LARDAWAYGINKAGQVVGEYEDSGGVVHGFLHSNGTYTTIDDPLGTNGNWAIGINDAGQIVGDYEDSNGQAQHAFLATTPPATPAARLDSAIVNGYVNAVHDTAAQALTGTAENGSTVTIYDNGTEVGTTTADASTGVWSFPISVLANGPTTTP
jgi:probable HAF family extracellular repeat protein